MKRAHPAWASCVLPSILLALAGGGTRSRDSQQAGSPASAPAPAAGADLTRVLVTLAVGKGARFGPTAAVLMRTMGTTGGIAPAGGTLVLQAAAPLAVAIVAFGRRDW